METEEHMKKVVQGVLGRMGYTHAIVGNMTKTSEDLKRVYEAVKHFLKDDDKEDLSTISHSLF